MKKLTETHVARWYSPPARKAIIAAHVVACFIWNKARLVSLPDLEGPLNAARNLMVRRNTIHYLFNKFVGFPP